MSYDLKPEDKLSNKLDDPDLLVLSGSHLYGTNHEGSDKDYRGFLIPPWEYIVGFRNFKDSDNSLYDDYKIYSLKRFLELVLEGDPQTTEMLFAPDDFILKQTEFSKQIINLRQNIVSDKLYHRLIGYSYSEWRKAEGVKLHIEDRTKTEDSVIDDIRNTFSLEKEDIDKIISILFQNKKRTKIPNKKSLGEKRKKEFDLYGYCVSSASHAIRLTQQLCELMETGFITLPRPNAQFLSDIRLGKVDFNEAEEEYQKSVEKCEELRPKSVLPAKPNYKFVWGKYDEVIREFLLNDSTFIGGNTYV